MGFRFGFEPGLDDLGLPEPEPNQEVRFGPYPEPEPNFRFSSGSNPVRLRFEPNFDNTRSVSKVITRLLLVLPKFSLVWFRAFFVKPKLNSEFSSAKMLNQTLKFGLKWFGLGFKP